jgi:uncharacterized protein (DUF433 family)
MALDWSKCPAVESVPGKVSGAWVFRGRRLPGATIFENLEDGMSIEEITEQFDVTREQVTAVLDFAARSLEAPVRRQCWFSLSTERHEELPVPSQGHVAKEARAQGWDTLK